MIEVWHQYVQNWPYLQIIIDFLAIIVPLATLLAYTGLFFISALARIIGVSRKRSSYEKCSHQLAFLALCLGWILLCGARIWLYLSGENLPENSIASYMTEMSWLLFSMGVLLGTIYYFLWKILKNMPVLHVTLGMLASIQNCVALAAIIFTIRISNIVFPYEQFYKLPSLFPKDWESSIITIASYTLPLVFGLAASYGLCWIALRRKSDDFGRDYYNTMLRWCAAWAKNSWIIFIILLLTGTGLKIWDNYITDSLNIYNLILDISYILVSAITAIFWIIIQKSALPVRHIWLIYLAFPISIFFSLPYYLNIISL